MKGVQAAMTTRNLDKHRWRNCDKGVWLPEDGDSCYETG